MYTYLTHAALVAPLADAYFGLAFSDPQRGGWAWLLAPLLAAGILAVRRAAWRERYFQRESAEARTKREDGRTNSW